MIPSFLHPEIQIIEDLTGIPVLGIMPYFHIPLPSEDSLSIADKVHRNLPIRIAVIHFPHVSNFTDFELLEQYASVEYVPCDGSLESYDCIILPGTKNTIDDLDALRKAGMDHKLSAARQKGVPVIGICGGYQMLGKTLVDEGFESAAGIYPGLGLLDCITRFASYTKNTTQVRRRAALISPILSSIGEVTGDEIHMGVTEPGSDREAFSGDGRVSPDGLVFGTYMHGLFLNPTAANALLTYLYGKKGLPYTPIPVESADPYDQLACLFEEHVDVDAIVAMLNA